MTCSDFHRILVPHPTSPAIRPHRDVIRLPCGDDDSIDRTSEIKIPSRVVDTESLGSARLICANI